MGNRGDASQGSLQTIRQKAAPTKIIKEEHETETWIRQEYAEQDIGRELRNLASRKSHGSDGEAYQATRKWAVAPITRIMNAI